MLCTIVLTTDSLDPILSTDGEATIDPQIRPVDHAAGVATQELNGVGDLGGDAESARRDLRQVFLLLRLVCPRLRRQRCPGHRRTDRVGGDALRRPFSSHAFGVPDQSCLGCTVRTVAIERNMRRL